MKSITDQDYAGAAAELGANKAQVKAVAKVEAPGSGFLDDGQVKILFEAHHFARLTAHKYNRTHPNISSPRWNRNLYVGGAGEHKRLQQAVALNRSAALQSASWGKFQIMGFNYRLAGFASIQAFINAMISGEAAQLQAFVNFVRNSRLDDELRMIGRNAVSCAPFAEGYNGPGYAVNQYDKKIAAAYISFGGT
jgi:hypothetical protein